tara:strand:+ start:2492 stop:3130 length:639 start_codon:yes stop_codon:yes gene_type:complete
LKLTENENKPILELGQGHGSTQKIHDYSTGEKKKAFSVDTHEEWSKKFEHLNNKYHSLEFVESGINLDNWLREVTKNDISVCLVDHAPGARRQSDTAMIHDKCSIMVLHDTENCSSANYNYENIWNLFKYRLDCTYIPSHGGDMVMTSLEDDDIVGECFNMGTMVSNKYNLDVFSGLELNGFKFKKRENLYAIDHPINQIRRERFLELRGLL